jgi:hypothetical protein
MKMQNPKFHAVVEDGALVVCQRLDTIFERGSSSVPICKSTELPVGPKFAPIISCVMVWVPCLGVPGICSYPRRYSTEIVFTRCATGSDTLKPYKG